MLSSRLVPTTPAPTHCRHKLLHCPAATNNLSGVQPHQQQQRHAQEQRQEELRTRQQVSATQQQQEQQQQQLQLRLSPPGRKYVQLWKTKRPGRKPRLLDAPTDPADPLYGTTKRERKAALQQQLQRQYGPAAGDRDVRLYLKKRALNAARPRGTRRGGLPLDDSFDHPGTFLKLSPDFQRTVLLERVSELTSALHTLSPESAWQLYTTLPGLLTLSTLEVAQRLTGLAHALQLNNTNSREAALQCCIAFPPLAFLDPDTVMSRVGLLAKVVRLQEGGGGTEGGGGGQGVVALMQQYPALWMMNSRALAARVEQLSLLLRCCPLTSVKLIGSCPELLSAPLGAVQQQLTALCSVMGVAAGQPDRVVPLLLWKPALLLLDAAQPPPQRQPQPQPHLQEADTHNDPVAAVGMQIDTLASVLQLPGSVVQELVLRAPDLLHLAAGGPAAVAAAEAALNHSWLLGGCSQQQRGAKEEEEGQELVGGVPQRQQYQQQLLQLLRPWQYSRIAKKRRVKQPQGSSSSGSVVGVSAAASPGGAGWYDAVHAAEAAVVSCQWWADVTQSQQQQQGDLSAQRQQLLLQAPALLVLAAGDGVLPAEDSQSGCALDHRVQQLSDQLSQLLVDNNEEGGVDDGAQQQQQELPHTAVKQLAVLEPCVLTRPPGWVASQLQQLAAALKVPVSTIVGLFCKHPALLWLTQAQVCERVRVLCGVLKLPAGNVKQLLVGQSPGAAQLLLMHPEAVKRGFVAACSAVAAGDEAWLRQTLQKDPALLLPGSDLTARRRRSGLTK